MKYRCDICQELSQHLRHKNYFGYNSTYGYCDNPACKKQADNNLSGDMQELIELGDFEGAMEMAGDECPSQYI